MKQKIIGCEDVGQTTPLLRPPDKIIDLSQFPVAIALKPKQQRARGPAPMVRLHQKLEQLAH